MRTTRKHIQIYNNVLLGVLNCIFLIFPWLQKEAFPVHYIILIIYLFSIKSYTKY